MKTYFLVALTISALLLPICLAQYKKPEDFRTSCAYIAKQNNRYVDAIHETYQHCAFCKYSYNNSTDQIYGGCATCPDQDGKCSVCVEGYVLYDSKCVPCGDSIETCKIANNDFSKDAIIQEVLKDINNSSSKTPQQKNLASMQVYQKYLAIRADKCSLTTDNGMVLELGHMCKNFEHCEKLEKTSSSVSCSKCQSGYFFDSEFSCTQQCNASIVNYATSYEYVSEQVCNDCSFTGECKKCPKGSVEVNANNADALKVASSKKNSKVCQKCMDNCSSCSVSDSTSNKIVCNTCKTGFFYNSSSNTCNQCSVSSHLLNTPSQSQLNSMQITCSGSEFTSVNWSATSITQTDALNQVFSYNVKTTSDNKAYVCGEGAISCQLSNGVVVNTDCLYGYALKDNKCINCSELVANSILCEFNANMNTYIPTLCTVGSEFEIPYTSNYYLQVTIGEIDTLVKEQNFSYSNAPNPNTWCQKNVNQCKKMIPLVQKLQLQQGVGMTDEEYQGGCSECFVDSDIPVQYQKLQEVDFFTIQNKISTCHRCSDIPNAAKCSVVENKLVPTACASSFFLDSSDNTCKKCDASCAECNTNASTCSKCATGKSLTNANTCSFLESSNLLQNCVSQKDVNGVQSCQTCSENYELVEESENVYKCSAKLIQNCEQMEDATCVRCVQNEKQYYLKNNRCVPIPQGCASFTNGNCTTCQYSYKPVTVNEIQVCIPCYQQYQDLQSYIQYDCPGKVKSSTLEDDKGIDVQSTTNSLVLAFSAFTLLISALLF